MYTAHVVSHTHWDREWYRPFQEFRWRLVEMMDFLIDLLETNPDYRHFYLDGQTIVLEDYLAIRPENRERLQELLDSGRLYVGPWYIQPDEFLVSGEAIIRNLLLGRRQCAAWGNYTRVGYAPDAFGHISQTPQILRGFGIDNAVLFRGITTDQVDSEFLWRSPDGSEVLGIKMPDDTAYSNFFYHFRQTLSHTPLSLLRRGAGGEVSPLSRSVGEGPGVRADGGELDREQVLQEARSLYEESLAQRPNTNHLLWMDGVDHIFPQPRTPQIIAIVNEGMSGEVRAIHSTLPEFIAAVRAAHPELKAVTGELRHSNRCWRLQALLAGVASSRIHLKQRNHACETLLERYAEPYAAIASRLGKPYPTDFLNLAWKYLLQNQPHDSICGCSIDQVHMDMLYRYDQCEILAEKIGRDSLSHIASQINTSAPISPSSPSDAPVKPLMPDPLCALVVFNPLAWPRTEVVETVVEIPAHLAPQDGEIAIRGPQGDAVPCTFGVPMKDSHTLNQTPFDIPVGERHKRWKVRFPAAVPAFGYQTYFVTPESPAQFPPAVVVGERSIENAFLKLEIAWDHTLTVLDKETGAKFTGGLVFELSGDNGDGYNYVKPENDEIVYSGIGQFLRPDADENGGYQAATLTLHSDTVRIHGDTEKNLLASGAIWVVIRLDAVSRYAKVEVDTNRHNFHNFRLRMLFPSGRKDATHSHAEQAFDVVERSIALPDCTGWKEPQPGTYPMKTFVDVSDGKVGFAVINKGMPEYEVKDDAQRTLALTLLRAVGNGVGTPEQQKEGQMPGAYTFEYALYPHAGDWEQGRVWQEGHSFNVPLRAVQTDLHEGPLPRAHSFFRVGPETLVPTALKLSEDGQALIFRAFNIGSEPLTPEVRPSDVLNLAAPTRVRLDEEPDPEAAETLPPKRIATWRFEAKAEG
ncbi:MAG TPA: glycoside hydrolase family 38 C-terminal domain-containing protein [Chthonomonadaceae bacterium]|nr:glycoside hydrolase family 38 C-terminal domain-containing protein [Chthonomonadaceae bacterium]